ncbi:MAG: hypothetical protein N2C14_22470, partial [Planctomycetales bacterium]
ANLCGKRLQITFQTAEGEKPASGSSESSAPKQGRPSVEDHPMFQRAVELFQAKLVRLEPPNSNNKQ